MGYAEVSVNSPVAQRRTFSYAIPSGLTIDVGQAVWVPFGDKLLQGIVLELSDYPSVEETREIAGIIDPHPVLSPARVRLARWLSEYYLSPLFEAVALMLPPGFERKTVTFISTPSTTQEPDMSSLTQEQRGVLELVWKRGKISLRELEKRLGSKQAKLIISQLVSQGLIVKGYELEKI
ncbi:unnamed protein product, partial [marine sediment metagenome]